MASDRIQRRPARRRDKIGIKFFGFVREPRLEVLEQRALLSTLSVSTTNDDAFTPSNVNAMGQLSNHGGEVTLRSAIFASNLDGGSNTIEVPGGTYLLSIVGNDDDDLAGDLDVTSAVQIQGAGSASTIIEAGTTASNGIDKVFSFNPEGASPGFAVGLSGLTIRFGKNPVTKSTGDQEGGGFDFNAGPGGSGSLSMTNVLVTQNSTENGDGGGIALLGGGLVTISDSQITDNSALNSAGRHVSSGGGIDVASAPSGVTGSVTIDDSTISGNLAAGDGGGLYAGSPTLVEDSLIANNSANLGGGVDSKANGDLLIEGSRVVGNTSITGASAAAGKLGTANVDVANNWFGSNDPSTREFARGTVPTHLVLTLSATPSTFVQGGTANLTAAITTNSVGQTGFSVPDGTPVSFSASAGTPNPSSASLMAGVASASLTPQVAGNVTVNADVDGQVVSTAIHADLAPTLISNPAGKTVDTGQSVTFSASASGTPSPSVQWQVSTDGGSTYSAIFGASATSYTFVTSASENGDRYRAIFTNAVGSVASASALLTVDFPPTITAEPTNQGAFVGNPVSFSATAIANPAASVQWQISSNGTSFSNISGATSSTYTFTATANKNGDSFRAIFTNGLGSATTTSATLAVATAPAITSEPSSQSVGVGEKATFSAMASGSPSPSVQWQSSTDGGSTWNNISGATSDTYSVTVTEQMDGNEYRAVFNNSAGTATTSAATLTVTYAPAILVDPQSQTIVNGTSVTFSASASGSPTPTIQWQESTDGGESFTDILFANSDNYTISTSISDSGEQYRAVFTNIFGSATTSVATLTVDNPPVVTSSPGNQSVQNQTIVNFFASASGTDPITVAWQISTDGGNTYSDIPGANQESLTFVATDSENNDQFRAVFSNPVGTVVTDSAILTVT